MPPEHASIVACKTLAPEIELVMRRRGLAMPLVLVESGRHAWPDRLRECIQESIDSVPAGRTVLLAFGFCGNSMVGVKSRSHTLVMPRVADCVPIFLGSRAAREAHGIHTYFYTKGYLESDANLAKEYRRVLERYGKKRGDRVAREMMKQYQHIAIIDTGAFDPGEVAGQVAPLAAIVEVPVSVVPGNLRLIDALLTGEWGEDEFYILPGGSEVSLEMSLNLGVCCASRV
jgi:hypothetical protein